MISDNKLRIVFVAEYVGERPLKLAYGLRHSGIPCLLLHLGDIDFQKSTYFDYTIQYRSPNECVEILNRIKPDVVHIFSFHGDDTSLAILENVEAKIVYDYKDTFENCIADPVDPILWQKQRVLVERADGLCCRDRQMHHYLKVNKIIPSGKYLEFTDQSYGLDLCLMSKTSCDEVHVVSLGNFILEDAYPQYSSAGLYLLAERFAQEGIHFHLYPGGWSANILAGKPNSIYRQLAKKTPYFHLHKSLPVIKLISEISQYDVGILLYQGESFGIPENYALDKHYQYGFMTRAFDYLEARLDILVQSSFLFQVKILQQYEVGCVVDSNYIFSDLKNKLLTMKRNFDADRINQAAINASIGKNINKLIDFYKNL